MAGTAIKKPASITTPTSKKTSSSQSARGGSSAVKKNANASILNFFKKTDGPPQSKQHRLTEFGVTISRNNSNGSKNNVAVKEESSFEGLFIEDKNSTWKNLVDIRDEGRSTSTNTKKLDVVANDILAEPRDARSDGSDRFNENLEPMKRRKVESQIDRKEKEQRGPFIDESDSEDEEEEKKMEDKAHKEDEITQIANIKSESPVALPTPERSDRQNSSVEPPPLVRAASSNFNTSALADDYDDIEDEIEGEDFLERSWIEAETKAFDMPEDEVVDDGPSCPICQADLAGQSDSVGTQCFMMDRVTAANMSCRKHHCTSMHVWTAIHDRYLPQRKTSLHLLALRGKARQP